MVGSVGSDRSVSIAGAIRSSMRSATPGACHAVARHGGPLLAHVAAQQRAAGGQATGDAQRRVPGEGADLDGAAGADQPGEQCEQLALIGSDLHARHRAQGRCLVA